MNNKEKEILIKYLDEAISLVAQSTGGYSGEFLSAEEFHLRLKQSVDLYKQGDTSQIKNYYSWFAPTSSWDDFTGEGGIDLGNKIFDLLSPPH